MEPAIIVPCECKPLEDTILLTHGHLAGSDPAVQPNSSITYQSELVLVLAYEVMQLRELLACADSQFGLDGQLAQQHLHLSFGLPHLPSQHGYLLLQEIRGCEINTNHISNNNNNDNQ